MPKREHKVEQIIKFPLNLIKTDKFVGPSGIVEIKNISGNKRLLVRAKTAKRLGVFDRGDNSVRVLIKALAFKWLHKGREQQFEEVKHISATKTYYLTNTGRMFVESGGKLVELKRKKSEVKENYWGFRLHVKINGTVKLKFFYIHYLLAAVFKGVKDKNIYQAVMLDGNYNNLRETNVAWRRRDKPKVDFLSIFNGKEYESYQKFVRTLTLKQKTELIDKITQEYMQVRHLWKNENIRKEFWERMLK